MKPKILGDFQICISVPLKPTKPVFTSWHFLNLRSQIVLSINLTHCSLQNNHNHTPLKPVYIQDSLAIGLTKFKKNL